MQAETLCDNDVEALNSETFIPDAVSIVELGKQLLLSAKNGDTDTVRDLMCRGAPFTTDWLGTSALHLAAQNNHTETAEVLLRAGISRDARTKVDRTPLHMAAYEGHNEMAQLLLNYGADVDSKDMLKMTPLHWAVEREHIEVMNVLLEHGADANSTSKFDKTPISLALEHDRLDLVDVLQQEREIMGIHAQQQNQANTAELEEATHSLIQLEAERQQQEQFQLQQQQQQQQQQQDPCTDRVSIQDSEQESNGDSSRSSERYEYAKDRFVDYKKVKSEQYTSRDSPISQNGSYHSSNDMYEYKKVKSELYTSANQETTRKTERYEHERLENGIYGNRDTANEIYGSRERTDIYSFKQTESIDVYSENIDDTERTWPETPPPLPPRLRHLPPVHMSLEERHKIAGRSRSLPPPPPYRPPPQPRAPITTRHLGYPRSLVDDESYV